jgi:hypothetical protein
MKLIEVLTIASLSLSFDNVFFFFIFAFTVLKAVVEPFMYFFVLHLFSPFLFFLMVLCTRSIPRYNQVFSYVFSSNFTCTYIIVGDEDIFPYDLFKKNIKS